MEPAWSKNPRGCVVKRRITPAVRALEVPNGIVLYWKYPQDIEIIEYRVFMAVRTATYKKLETWKTVKSTRTMLLFKKVYDGPNTKCVIRWKDISNAYLKAYTEAAIILRFVALSVKGYIPATEARYTLDYLFNTAQPRETISFNEVLPAKQRTPEAPVCLQPIDIKAVIVPGQLYLLPKVPTYVTEADNSTTEEQ